MTQKQTRSVSKGKALSQTNRSANFKTNAEIKLICFSFFFNIIQIICFKFIPQEKKERGALSLISVSEIFTTAYLSIKYNIWLDKWIQYCDNVPSLRALWKTNFWPRNKH
jgi:hypothetical protein